MTPPRLLFLLCLVLSNVSSSTHATETGLQTFQACSEHLHGWVEERAQDSDCIQLGALLSDAAITPPSAALLESVCQHPCYGEIVSEIQILVDQGCPRLPLGTLCDSSLSCNDGEVCRSSVCERICSSQSDCTGPLEICDRGSCRVTVFDVLYPVSAPLLHLQALLNSICMSSTPSESAIDHPNDYCMVDVISLPKLATCHDALATGCCFPAIHELLNQCPSSIRPQRMIQLNQIAAQCAGQFTQDLQPCSSAPEPEFQCPQDLAIEGSGHSQNHTGSSCGLPNPVSWDLGYTSSGCGSTKEGSSCQLGCVQGFVVDGNTSLYCEESTWKSHPQGLGVCVGLPCDVGSHRNHWPNVHWSCPGSGEVVDSGQRCQLSCTSQQGVPPTVSYSAECYGGSFLLTEGSTLQSICQGQELSGESRSNGVTEGLIAAVAFVVAGAACVVICRMHRRRRKEWVSVGLDVEGHSPNHPRVPVLDMEDDGWAGRSDTSSSLG